MDSALISAIASSDFQLPPSIISATRVLPFTCGILLLSPIPPSDPFPALSLISSGIAAGGNTNIAATLGIKFCKELRSLPSLPTAFDETKCVILAGKTIAVLPNLAVLTESIREELVRELGKAACFILETVTAESLVVDLQRILRQRVDLLGERILNQLSPTQSEFLLGRENRANGELVAAIAKLCDTESLLSAFLYLRIYELLQRPEYTDFARTSASQCEFLFSTNAKSRLFAVSVVPESLQIESSTLESLKRLYTFVRKDLADNTHVSADQLADELRNIASNPAHKEELYESAVALMLEDEVMKDAATAWKLLLFGMHKLRLYGGAKWKELNDTLNQKFPQRKEPAKRWVKVEKRSSAAIQREVENPTEPAPAAEIPAISDPFDPRINPWDLPSVDSKSANKK